VVPVPFGSTGMQGPDGRMVAVPDGEIRLAGRDGRMVPIPPGKVGVVDRRGRMRAEEPGAPPSEPPVRIEADASSIDDLPDWRSYAFAPPLADS